MEDERHRGAANPNRIRALSRRGESSTVAVAMTSDFPTPIDRHRERVRPEWIDYNGHMNVAYYVLVFDHGTDVLFDLLDVGAGYRARSNCSLFAMEGTSITWRR
jgi:hypothetical protein